MKKLLAIFCFIILIMGCKDQQQKKEEHNHQETQTQEEDVPKKKPLSPHTSAMAMVGDAHIHGHS